MSFGQYEPIQNLSPEVKAQAVAAARPAAALMDRVAVHHQASHSTTSSHSGDRDALLHNQSSSEKTQSSLSPTDNHKGHTQSQGRAVGRDRSIQR